MPARDIRLTGPLRCQRHPHAGMFYRQLRDLHPVAGEQGSAVGQLNHVRQQCGQPLLVRQWCPWSRLMRVNVIKLAVFLSRNGPSNGLHRQASAVGHPPQFSPHR